MAGVSDTLAEGSNSCQEKRASFRFESSWRVRAVAGAVGNVFLKAAGGGLGLGRKRCLGTELTASDGLQTNGILS